MKSKHIRTLGIVVIVLGIFSIAFINTNKPEEKSVIADGVRAGVCASIDTEVTNDEVTAGVMSVFADNMNNEVVAASISETVSEVSAAARLYSG